MCTYGEGEKWDVGCYVCVCVCVLLEGEGGGPILKPCCSLLSPAEVDNMGQNINNVDM